METKLEVSYVYDPEKKTLDCEASYNGTKDSFCVMYDDLLTMKDIQEFVNGFLLYLKDKQKE